jgi:hypothetical protein
MDEIILNRSSIAAIDLITNTDNEFRILGLPPSASVDADRLRKRFKQISLLIHPDKCFNDDRATAAMQKLVSARDNLRDPTMLPGAAAFALFAGTMVLNLTQPPHFS